MSSNMAIKGHIYFGQMTNEHDIKYNVYKIGATQQTISKRLKNFRHIDPEAKFIRTWDVVCDVFLIESIIKTTLRRQFKLDRGTEWFIGREKKLIRHIESIIHDFNRPFERLPNDESEDMGDSDHEADDDIDNDPNYLSDESDSSDNDNDNEIEYRDRSDDNGSSDNDDTDSDDSSDDTDTDSDDTDRDVNDNDNDNDSDDINKNNKINESEKADISELTLTFENSSISSRPKRLAAIICKNRNTQLYLQKSV